MEELGKEESRRLWYLIGVFTLFTVALLWLLDYLDIT